MIRDRFIAAHPWCKRCGKRGKHVDHIIPISAGGTHDERNLQTLCHSCHAKKTALFDGSFGKPKKAVSQEWGGG